MIMKKAEDKYHDKVKPNRFYDELAEYGYLEEFLKTRLKDHYRNDLKFREEMQEIMLRKSSKVVTDIEILYLENLCENLGYFLEYIKPWKNRKL
jgi:hypothetical protein